MTHPRRAPVSSRHALVVAALTALAAPALAQPTPSPAPLSPGGVCVAIDASKDNLAEGERNAVRSLALLAFQAEGLATDESGTACAETYLVTNIRLGNTINVSIAGPRGQRNGRATTLDDLANVYAQLVKALVTDTTTETGGGAVDRGNVTRDQAAPRRVAADRLKYVTLGYGGVLAGKLARGPAFGFGYRFELDRIGIDASLGFILANDGDGFGVTGYYPRLAGIWYQEPLADASAYYGVGLSYGGTAVEDADDKGLTGAGLQGHATAGYEMLRSSTIRFFGQLDLTLPTYTSTGGGAERYTPSLSLQIGLGWGKGNTIRVAND